MKLFNLSLKSARKIAFIVCIFTFSMQTFSMKRIGGTPPISVSRMPFNMVFPYAGNLHRPISSLSPSRPLSTSNALPHIFSPLVLRSNRPNIFSNFKSFKSLNSSFCNSAIQRTIIPTSIFEKALKIAKLHRRKTHLTITIDRDPEDNFLRSVLEYEKSLLDEEIYFFKKQADELKLNKWDRTAILHGNFEPYFFGPDTILFENFKKAIELKEQIKNEFYADLASYIDSQNITKSSNNELEIWIPKSIFELALKLIRLSYQFDRDQEERPEGASYEDGVFYGDQKYLFDEKISELNISSRDSSFIRAGLYTEFSNTKTKFEDLNEIRRIENQIRKSMDQARLFHICCGGKNYFYPF